MKPKILNFINAADGALKVTLYGTMYGDWWNGSEEANLRDAIRGAGDRPCTVYINSDGGDMFTGVAMYNILSQHKGQVTCIVEGLAASAASVVAMAGQTVMGRGAMLMVHNPWWFAAGDADALRAAAGTLDKCRDALIEIYSAKTGKKAAELQALLKAETWMTADEAIAAGFANRVIDATMTVEDLAGDVVLNRVAFPRSHVPMRILAMARPQKEMSMSVAANVKSKADKIRSDKNIAAVIAAIEAVKDLQADVGEMDKPALEACIEACTTCIQGCNDCIASAGGDAMCIACCQACIACCQSTITCCTQMMEAGQDAGSTAARGDNEMAALLTLTGATSPAAALGVVTAWKEGHGAARSTAERLRAEARAQAARDRKASSIFDSDQGRRMITPAQRASFWPAILGGATITEEPTGDGKTVRISVEGVTDTGLGYLEQFMGGARSAALPAPPEPPNHEAERIDGTATLDSIVQKVKKSMPPVAAKEERRP